MSALDLMVILILGAGVLGAGVAHKRNQFKMFSDLENASIEHKLKHPESQSNLADGQDEDKSFSLELPQSPIAIIFYVLGAVAVLAGLGIFGTSNYFGGFISLASAISSFAMASGLQYLFDIRNILLRQERNRNA